VPHDGHVLDRHGGRALPSDAYGALFHTAPVAFLVIRADDLVMIDANPPYLEAVGMTLEDIAGRYVFDVFPNSPTNADADQRTDLLSLMRSAIESKGPVTVEAFRYDIPSGDGFDVRWWNVIESPVLDGDEVTHLLHYTEDVTDLVRARADLTRAELARETSAEQTARLAEVALALTGAETVDDLERIVVTRGLAVLGADGGGVITRDPSGDFRISISEGLSGELRQALDRREEPAELEHVLVPYDDPMPGGTAARTGRSVILPDKDSGIAFHAGMADVYDAIQREAWACLPLNVQDGPIGAIAVGWTEPQEFTAADIELMEGFAAQCATALDRLEKAEELRRSSRRFQELAESLQSAMLTAPTADEDLQVAVRYRSADDLAQVGGDWYDSFLQPDGATTVVIGDVSGHDEVAAAKMGQIRGLLRALAYDAADRPHGDSPATVLTRFEHVAQGLEVDEMSTAILARIEPRDTSGPERSLRWSNAGNPPPVVLLPDGQCLLLDEKSDLLLGVDPSTDRRDHRLLLAPGSTLLLYTDGLIERRGSSIDVGLDDLCAALSSLAGAGLDAVCDGVLERLAAHTGEDDIALVAVRV
jgi:PAS domain S-box-containing protein